jgi:CheY-like chemotaxis protein
MNTLPDSARGAVAASSSRPFSAEGQRRLVGYLRHELRTSLTAILGYSEHLLDDLAHGASDPMERPLLDLRAIGAALLSEVNARLAIDTVNDAPGSGLALAVQELSVTFRAEAERIEALCAELIKASERAHRFGLIPTLCRIQAAGRMLSHLLDGYAPEVASKALRARPESLVASPRACAASDVGPAPPPPSLLHAGRLLIADDNSVNRDLFRRSLAQKGYEVEEASGGLQALSLIRETDYDVILLDLLMPDLTGLGVLEALKQEGRLGLTPIMMLSAADEVEDVVRCIERGADDYVTKPFNMVLLDARLRMAVELKRHRQRERRALGDPAHKP